MSESFIAGARSAMEKTALLPFYEPIVDKPKMLPGSKNLGHRADLAHKVYGRRLTQAARKAGAGVMDSRYAISDKATGAMDAYAKTPKAQRLMRAMNAKKVTGNQATKNTLRFVAGKIRG